MVSIYKKGTQSKKRIPYKNRSDLVLNAAACEAETRHRESKHILYTILSQEAPAILRKVPKCAYESCINSTGGRAVCAIILISEVASMSRASSGSSVVSSTITAGRCGLSP